MEAIGSRVENDPMRHLRLSLTLTVLLVPAAAVQAQETEERAADAPPSAVCGEVSIAELNWPSAAFFAHLDAIILAEGYGCDISLIKGDTLSTLTRMVEEGSPDISPETWINSARETLDEAVASRDLHYMAPAFADGGVEGWWIPAYVAEAHPDIKTVADALKRPDLFPSPDNDGMGAVHTCPEGWSCEVTTANLFQAYQASDKGFELLPSDDGDALEASIAEAFAEQRGWLGYYWAPTAALGRYDMVKLNFDAPYNDAEWHGCTTDPECPAPRITSWPRSEVYTVVTDQFMRRGNGALNYLRTRSLGNEVLSNVLAYMADNGLDGESTATAFLRENETIWADWVSPEAKARIDASLSKAD